MLSPENTKFYQIIQDIGDVHILMILSEFYLYRELSFNELRSKLNISPTTLTKKLKHLEQLSFVIHDKDDRGFKHMYTLTTQGTKLLPVIKAFKKVSSSI